MKYRSVFISDLHLGSPYSNSDKLLEFLKENKYDKLYLVGDIIDMINMRHKFYWSKSNNKVIKYILKISKKIDVVYIVGNHDYFMETFIDESFGNILIKEKDIYVTKKGKKYLVQHGHQYDGIIKSMTWLYILGDKAYGVSLFLNKWINILRKKLGLRQFSLSLFLKKNVKNVIQFLNKYEFLVIEDVKKHDVDGVIVGHIHSYANHNVGGIHYLNCGSWVESPETAIVENLDGEMKVLIL